MNSSTLRRAGRVVPLLAILALGIPAIGHAAVPGVNIDSTSNERVDQAIATGAKFARMFVLWSQLEPDGPNSYPSKNAGAANVTAQYDNAIRRLNAAGVKPIFVVLGSPPWANGGSPDNLVPPTDPNTYATFLAKFAAHNATVGDIAAYEVWNEADEPEFWHGPSPGAVSYAPLLAAAYKAAKPVAGSAAILASPTTANNAAFIQGLYERGLKGSFDGVSVHTDTACLTNPPDKFLRDGVNGPINRYGFLGYREVRRVMLANGDPAPKIWMTELGWTSSGGTALCERGSSAGKSPSGVTEAQQAAYLTRAYGCLAQDDYVVAANWFTLVDRTDLKPDEINHYGLLNTAGAQKPAYAAFKAVTAANGGAPGPCGDFDGPAIKIVSPTPNLGFTGRLLIQASGTDVAAPGVTPSGVTRLTFRIDGSADAIGKFPVTDGAVAKLDWFGSLKIPDGKHTLTVDAVDAGMNQGSASVVFFKGAQYVKAGSSKTKIGFAKGKVPKCKARTCTVKGRLTGPPGLALSGRVRVEWQLFVRQRVKSKVKGQKRFVSKYRTYYKGGSSAAKPFSFTQKLARKGRWRVRVSYDGAPPLKKTTSAWKVFKV